MSDLDKEVERIKAADAQRELDQQRKNTGADKPMPWESGPANLSAYRRRQRTPEEQQEEARREQEEARREQARQRQREVSYLGIVGIPDKEIEFLMTGRDRWGRERDPELESWRLLDAELQREPRRGTIVMSGPPGTGKSSSAAAAIYKYRKAPYFHGSAYIRAAHLASVARDSGRERELLTAHLLVIDDLGDEGSKDWIGERLSHFISDRDDKMKGGEVTIITGNLGRKAEGMAKLAGRYGDRMLERLVEWGLIYLYSKQNIRRR